MYNNKEKLILASGKMNALLEMELEISSETFEKYYTKYNEECTKANAVYRTSDEFVSKQVKSL